jgi:hypothetical protein
MDFFAVPTLTFGVLYCFFVISDSRRKILRRKMTRNPCALWIVQSMHEAWPMPGFNHSLDTVACIIVAPWQHKRVLLPTYKM